MPYFPSEQLAQVQEEISSLREKGAISVVADPSLTHTEEKFFSTLFLVPKKNRSMRPVINLKALNKWVETPYFKMEGLPTLKDEAGRLVSQGGPERCILHCASPSRSPTLPEVCDRMSGLPVHLPPLRAAVCPLGLHQVDEGNADHTQVMGSQDGYLYRRYPDNGRVSSECNTALGGTDSPADMPRIHHQHGEVGNKSFPETSFWE